jgi:tetratricopeptide (TPR) repeat protein
MNFFDSLFRKSNNSDLPPNTQYELDSIDGINAIPIPEYSKFSGVPSPLNNIEYILQRKATDHKKNGRMDLAIACLRKANEIFPHSNFMWTIKDYMRLVKYLKQDGQFDKARVEEKRINDYFNQNDITVNVYQKILLDCQSLGTDLVITSDIARTCGECAKYSKRVLNISGRDKRFPVLPKYFGANLQEHSYCFISFYPFLLDYSEPNWNYRGTLINWSNRPFIDDRTKEQKEDFKKWVTENTQEIIDRKNYDFMREHIPEISPKSFGGFRRMKNIRSKNFMKLVEICKRQNIDLDEKPDLSMYYF